MGYVICENCGGYYELQPGEHREDFDRCDCGGKLRYELQMVGEDYNTPFHKSEFKLPSLSKSLKIIGALTAGVIVLLIKFLPNLIDISMNFIDPSSIGTGIPNKLLIFLIVAFIFFLLSQLKNYIRKF